MGSFFYYCRFVKNNTTYLLTGLSFSMLWASASIAGKFGLNSAEPLLFFTIRFLIAGVILLAYAHAIKKYRVPTGKEWLRLSIFGAFNTALYLGIFIVALQFITAGITALAIALNPLFISLLSSLLNKRKVKWMEWGSITLGLAGVLLASYPLLQHESISIAGLLLLGLSMITYSVGAVYYAGQKWMLERVTINGWQVLLGGLMTAPFALFMHQPGSNQFDSYFWLSLLWLVVPVSIVAVNLWLILLKADAVKASIWLYLCPIFGLMLSALLLNEPLTIYTWLGTALVLGAVFIGQQKNYAAGQSR
ncbi:MAG: EamA family transporter [Cyclobacteriaceae bacterium]|nr:EamA family transporter [Cyclobacteriaceae bacterium]